MFINKFEDLPPRNFYEVVLRRFKKCLNFKCILGIQDRRHRLRSRPMYVLFRYGIQTFYTAITTTTTTTTIIIIIIIVIITISKCLRVY